MAAKTVWACNMVKVGILKTKESTDDPWYCGAVCLPEHRLIIVERDWRVGKIRLHDRNTGDLIAKSDELPGPWSVCVLDKIGSLLAVALEFGSIQILSIQNTGPSVTIRSNKMLVSGLERCHGVSAIMSNKLVVSGRYEDMICWCVLSLDGMMDRIHRIIPISGTGDLDGRSYLATSGDLSRVYISCYSGLYSSGNGVYGYDVKSGDHKFTYRVSNLTNPRGICVDSRGYIYVCNCWDPFCIHQLTEQGESMTVFSEDIPRWPRAICLDENKEDFFITRRESNEVLRFRLEWNEQNAFPMEILNMDERSIRIYKEALQDGNETVYNIRVMVVGQYGVGKTTLTKRLLGKDVNLSERNSTEGIDVHINCCRVSLDTCEWIIEHKEDQHLRLQRVVKLLQEEMQRIEADKKQEGQSKVITQNDDTHAVGVHVNVDNVQADSEEKLNSFKIDSGQELSPKPRPTENVSVDNETKDPVLELIKMINTNVDKLEKNKVEFATMALWDYAGQYVFYTTHQTFLTRRAIYLLVTDLTQQITDLVRDDEFFFDSERIKLCNVQAKAISSLSSPASDTDRFMRIVCLLIDVGSKVLRRRLQHITVTFNCTLDQYLAKNKRDIYNLFKKKIVNQSQIDVLFPPSRGKTNLDEYDITLLTVLFNSIISGLSQQERDMIHCLRENRNKIYGHAKSSKLDCQEYRLYWASISSSLMNLCKQCRDNDFENEILLEIQRIQTLTSKIQELESRKSSDDNET